MLFEEYAFITKQSTSFKPLTQKEKEEANQVIKMIASRGAGIQLTDADVNTIAKTPTAAIKNAVPAQGKFPLIVCGVQGGPSLNNVLYEYLASKGYVIVASAGSHNEGRMEAFDPQRALNERIGDMEFMSAFAAKLPYVDNDKKGMLGVNFEGMTAILYQMKNGDAQAIVSLDGWEGKYGSQATIQESIYYDAAKIRYPYFAVMQDEKDPPPNLALSQVIFDDFLYATRYYYVLNNMSHVYLIASMFMVPNLPADKKQAYEFLYTSIGHFYDAHLKHEEGSIAYLQNTQAGNHVPAGLIKSELKKPALPAAPNNDELVKMLDEGRWQTAITILKQAKQSAPNARITSGNSLNSIGYIMLRNHKFTEAIGLFTLNTELYPGDAGWFDSLAEAYEATGDKDNMKKAAQQVVNLLANKTPLSAADNALIQAAEKRLKD